MLLNLPYPQRQKNWNFKLLGILSLIALLAFLFSFKRVNGSKTRSFDTIPTLPKLYEGELSLLTYNIAGLPQIISSAQTERSSSIQTIGKRINSFDIVNLQEDFNYNDYLYEDNNHPYRTESMGGVPFGDGLSTLSKYPILHTERIAWKDCSGSDCLTPKGFSYSRIQLAYDVFLDVYNIHATAQDNSSAVEARKKNMKQLQAYMNIHSANQAVLIMGDFNAHYTFQEDNIKEVHQELGLTDCWIKLHQNDVIPPCDKDFLAHHALTVSEDTESIDKIYFRNSNHLELSPSKYKIEKELFSNTDDIPLSDHHAISLQLNWKVLNPTL